MGSCCLIDVVSVLEDERVPEAGCTTLSVYLMLITVHSKMVTMVLFVLCIFYCEQI